LVGHPPLEGNRYQATNGFAAMKGITVQSQYVGTSILACYFLAILLTDALILLAYYEAEYQLLLHYLLMEDSFYEIGTVLLYAIAAIFGFHALWRKRNDRLKRPDRAIVLGVSLLLIFAVMEELSWGQRLFDFKPTPFFMKHNLSKEINVHNLFPSPVEEVIIFTTVYIFFILMPLVIQLFSLDKRFSPFAGLAKYMPPLHIVLVFLCSVSIHPYRPQNLVEHLNIFMSIVSGLGITYLIFVRKVSYNSYTVATYFLLVFSVVVISIHGEVLFFSKDTSIYGSYESTYYNELNEFALSNALLLWLYWYCRRNQPQLPVSRSDYS
jgi:hypothetical protein